MTKKGSRIIGILLVALGIGLFAYAGFTVAQQQIILSNANFADIPPTLGAVAPAVLPAPAGAKALPTPQESPISLSKAATDAPTSVADAVPTIPPIPIFAPTRTAEAAATIPPIPTFARTASSPSVSSARVGTLPKPARIVVPTIRVDAPVVEMGWKIIVQSGEQVSEWEVPKNEVGHAINSPNPGERGNVVMAGHNNLYAAIFKKLYTLKVGDEITVYNTAGQAFLYRVAQSYIVKEEGESLEKRIENAKVMLPTEDARLTLISCWPEWSNTYRAIVIATLVGPLR